MICFYSPACDHVLLARSSAAAVSAYALLLATVGSLLLCCARSWSDLRRSLRVGLFGSIHALRSWKNLAL